MSSIRNEYLSVNTRQMNSDTIKSNYVIVQNNINSEETYVDDYSTSIIDTSSITLIGNTAHPSLKVNAELRYNNRLNVYSQTNGDTSFYVGGSLVVSGNMNVLNRIEATNINVTNSVITNTLDVSDGMEISRSNNALNSLTINSGGLVLDGSYTTSGNVNTKYCEVTNSDVNILNTSYLNSNTDTVLSLNGSTTGNLMNISYTGSNATLYPVQFLNSLGNTYDALSIQNNGVGDAFSVTSGGMTVGNVSVFGTILVNEGTTFMHGVTTGGISTNNLIVSGNIVSQNFTSNSGSTFNNVTIGGTVGVSGNFLMKNVNVNNSVLTVNNKLGITCSDINITDASNIIINSGVTNVNLLNVGQTLTVERSIYGGTLNSENIYINSIFGNTFTCNSIECETIYQEYGATMNVTELNFNDYVTFNQTNQTINANNAYVTSEWSNISNKMNISNGASFTFLNLQTNNGCAIDGVNMVVSENSVIGGNLNVTNNLTTTQISGTVMTSGQTLINSLTQLNNCNVTSSTNTNNIYVSSNKISTVSGYILKDTQDTKFVISGQTVASLNDFRLHVNGIIKGTTGYYFDDNTYINTNGNTFNIVVGGTTTFQYTGSTLVFKNLVIGENNKSVSFEKPFNFVQTNSWFTPSRRLMRFGINMQNSNAKIYFNKDDNSYFKFNNRELYLNNKLISNDYYFNIVESIGITYINNNYTIDINNMYGYIVCDTTNNNVTIDFCNMNLYSDSYDYPFFYIIKSSNNNKVTLTGGTGINIYFYKDGDNVNNTNIQTIDILSGTKGYIYANYNYKSTSVTRSLIYISGQYNILDTSDIGIVTTRSDALTVKNDASGSRFGFILYGNATSNRTTVTDRTSVSGGITANGVINVSNQDMIIFNTLNPVDLRFMDITDTTKITGIYSPNEQTLQHIIDGQNVLSINSDNITSNVQSEFLLFTIPGSTTDGDIKLVFDSNNGIYGKDEKLIFVSSGTDKTLEVESNKVKVLNNISAPNGLFTDIYGTFNILKQTNITQLGNLTSLNIGNTFNTSSLTATTIKAPLINGTLTTPNQTNITTVGTLSGLTMNGGISANNIIFTSGKTLTANNISARINTATQNVINQVGTLDSLDVNGGVIIQNGNFIVGSGITVNATNISGTISNTNSIQDLITQVGTLSELNVSGGVTCNGNLTVSTLNKIKADNIYGIIMDSNQNNITKIGVQPNLNVSGNVTVTNSALKMHETNSTILCNDIRSTVVTQSQPNINVLGELEDLSVNNLSVTNSISLSGINNTFTSNNGITANVLTISQPNITKIGMQTDVKVNGSVIFTETGTTTEPQMIQSASSYNTQKGINIDNTSVTIVDSGINVFKVNNVDVNIDGKLRTNNEIVFNKIIFDNTSGTNVSPNISCNTDLDNPPNTGINFRDTRMDFIINGSTVMNFQKNTTTLGGTLNTNRVVMTSYSSNNEPQITSSANENTGIFIGNNLISFAINSQNVMELRNVHGSTLRSSDAMVTIPVSYTNYKPLARTLTNNSVNDVNGSTAKWVSLDISGTSMRVRNEDVSQNDLVVYNENSVVLNIPFVNNEPLQVFENNFFSFHNPGEVTNLTHTGLIHENDGSISLKIENKTLFNMTHSNGFMQTYIPIVYEPHTITAGSVNINTLISSTIICDTTNGDITINLRDDNAGSIYRFFKTTPQNSLIVNLASFVSPNNGLVYIDGNTTYHTSTGQTAFIYTPNKFIQNTVQYFNGITGSITLLYHRNANSRGDDRITFYNGANTNIYNFWLVYGKN